MKKNLSNRFIMYKVVRDWLIANSAALESMPGFSVTLEEFNKLIEQIERLDEGKAATTLGLTQSKADAREQLEKLCIELIRILKVYATFSNNPVLLNDIDFTESQLKKVSEQSFVVRAQKVITHATEVQAEAEPYGLDTTKLGTAGEALETFKGKQSIVREAIVERKDAGEQLEAMMDEADDLLKGKLDLLLELAANTRPELLNQYKGARVIVDR